MNRMSRVLYDIYTLGGAYLLNREKITETGLTMLHFENTIAEAIKFKQFLPEKWKYQTKYNYGGMNA